MGFFEYLANNLVYLFIVIGALILVIGAGIFKFFILKIWLLALKIIGPDTPKWVNSISPKSVYITLSSTFIVLPSASIVIPP